MDSYAYWSSRMKRNIKNVKLMLKRRMETKWENQSKKTFKNLSCKKVIIRNDDVGGMVDPALKWLSNLVIEKNIKITYAVIPTALLDDPDRTFIHYYLNDLNKKNFEIATHGFTHEKFKGMPRDEQHSRIESATKIIEDCLHTKPKTFISPYFSDDVETTRACRALGYHSTSTNHSFPVSYIINFRVDFIWEQSWNPIVHRSFEDFRGSFDSFYSSSNEYYVIVLHHKTFLNLDNKINTTLANEFEKSIKYLKTKNVEFMTIEEAYEWYVDKDNIRFGKINENVYFIDLALCHFDHIIKIYSPFGRQINVLVTDILTGKVIGTYRGIIEFYGVKGHCYELEKFKE